MFKDILCSLGTQLRHLGGTLARLGCHIMLVFIALTGVLTALSLVSIIVTGLHPSGRAMAYIVSGLVSLPIYFAAWWSLDKAASAVERVEGRRVHRFPWSETPVDKTAPVTPTAPTTTTVAAIDWATVPVEGAATDEAFKISAPELAS